MCCTMDGGDISSTKFAKQKTQVDDLLLPLALALALALAVLSRLERPACLVQAGARTASKKMGATAYDPVPVYRAPPTPALIAGVGPVPVHRVT